jgi:prophage regulatory protein
MSNTSNSKTSYILKLRDVTTRCKVSKSKIYRDMSRGLFPKQVRMGSNCVGWLSYDIDNWIASLPVSPNQY